jgi:tol-pal system-associated acyl-CoA thioesterase
VETSTAEPEFSLPLRVYIEDTDAGGIVYYVNYLKFMERARTEFMRALGFGKAFIFNADLMFVVQSVDVRYLQPARLDDELEATVSARKIGGASMLLHQSVRRGETVLAEGEVKIACVNQRQLQPKRMPAEMLARLRAAQPP